MSMIVFSTPPDQQREAAEEAKLDHWKIVYEEVRRAYNARMEEVSTQ